MPTVQVAQSNGPTLQVYVFRDLTWTASNIDFIGARPAVIVLPERETPGTMANICATPIPNACFQVIFSMDPSCRA